MLIDSVFHSEGNTFRKLALLFTVPCAILPVLVATAGILSPADNPLLFKFDFLLYAAIYLLYGYGLLLSRKAHRKWLPLAVFLLHIAGGAAYLFWAKAEWLGYLVVVSILATSVINQYYRTGSVQCSACQAPSKDMLKTP